LRAFSEKLRTVQEWGANKKCSFCWEECFKIRSPKLENVTAQPRWITLPITPENILQA
jgi:hypothetical protein